MPNETDLWNLDEDLPASPAKPADDEKPVATTPSTQSIPEPVIRIESPEIRRRDRKAAKTREVDESDLAEKTPTPTPAAKPGMSPRSALPKSTPAGLGMTEDEVWSDFIEEEVIRSTPAIPTPAPLPSKESEVNAMPVPSLASDDKAPPVTAEPSPPIPPETWETSSEPPASAGETVAAAVAEKQDDQEVESFDPPAPGTSTKSWQITRFTRLEAMLSLACLLLLIGGGFWGAQLFRQHVQAQADPYNEPEFPAKGSLATIDTAETYWRSPIMDGPNADPTQREVILIPVIDVTLGSCAAPHGVIRVMFTNDKGEIVGDTITQAFRDSRFTSNDSSTASFSSTTGFTSYGEQEAYRAYLGKPWTIRVYEGPDATSPSSAFHLLFTTPISTKRK